MSKSIASPKLAEPFTMGKLVLKNRIAMASLTRNRAPFTIPGADIIKHYEDRAGAGLILVEATFITSQGSDVPRAPGIWNKKQVEGWKAVTAAVHAKKSAIFCQLWHIGRTAHPLLQGGQPIVSASAIAAKGGKFHLLQGQPGYTTPEMIENPWEIIELYKNAAKNALEANFDGVEFHAANGYLPNTFIEAHSNNRTDEWGGSPKKRSKFIIESIKALIEVTGDPKKVGIKLSPCGGFNDMGDPEDIMTEEYSYIITELNNLDIGYIQLSRYNPGFDMDNRATKVDVIKKFGHLVKKPLLLGNSCYSPEEAEEQIAEGLIGAVAFGRPYIINPDLAERILEGNPVEPWSNIEWNRLYNPLEGELPSAGYNTYKTFSA